MSITVLTICKDEREMIPFFLAHYSTFADRIIVWDEQSTDGTREIIKAHPKAELREWPHKGLDDQRFIHAVNSYYREFQDSTWVMWPDVDEFLYHPNMLKLLSESQEPMIAATGYALISKDGFPRGAGQIYEQVKTGFPQPNYDKIICWRPQFLVQHTIGRHTYPGQWPKCNGQPLSPKPKLKLFHCHHVGGVEHTRQINARNHKRAVDKRYSWNYHEEHNKKEQVGTVAWVEDLLARDALYDVVSEPKMKINFGCGSNLLEGWINKDAECDIRKPLPFADGVADRILAEHVVEHVTHQEAWSFFVECKRVLKRGGVLRVAIPDITRMQKKMTDEYRNAVKAGGHGDNPIRAAVFEHGHQAAWNQELLMTFLTAIGFKAEKVEMGKSSNSDLVGVEGHGKVVGQSVASVETSCVEATSL